MDGGTPKEGATSSAAQDDPELAEFTAALTSSHPEAFRSTVLWRAPVAQFDAKQQAPVFARDSWARWQREHRAGARFDVVAEADRRRRHSRAAIVRPLPDSWRPVHQQTPKELKLADPNVSTQCSSPPPAARSTPAMASVTPPARSPANDALTPTANSSITPQHISTPRRATARLLDPLPITPRTYKRLSKLPAPDTYMEGVSLIANILDSHYRLRSLQEDEVRHRRSVAYVTGKRLAALNRECASGRQEHLSAFLRLMQRVQTTERGPMDLVQVAQWFDGFVGCAMLGTPPDSAAIAETNSVESAFLGLSNSDTIDAEHPPTWLEYLMSPLRQPDSPAARALKEAERTEVLLPISALRTACTLRSIPLITKSTWDGHNTETTFLECLHRQLPNARHHLDNAVLQLMQAGVIPTPRWVVGLYEAHTFGLSLEPAAQTSQPRRWQLASNVVHGALGLLHGNKDDQKNARRRSSVGDRGLRTPPSSSLGNRRQTVMQNATTASPDDSPSSSQLRNSPSPQTPSLAHRHDLELSIEGLMRLMKSIHLSSGGEGAGNASDDERLPVVSVEDTATLSASPSSSSGDHRGSTTGDPADVSGAVLPAGMVVVAAAAASPAVLALMRKYDVDGSGGLSWGEFLSCAWGDKALHQQGRW